MKIREIKVGDRIRCNTATRFARESGEIIAINDNPYAKTNHFHVRFDRDEVRGAIGGKEIWLGLVDFDVIEE